MIVTTGGEVAGRAIQQYLGVVRGVVVRSPSIGQGFMGGLKPIVGGASHVPVRPVRRVCSIRGISTGAGSAG